MRPSLAQSCFLRSKKSAEKARSTNTEITVEQALAMGRVRDDLIEIASAENENISIPSRGLDLDELIKSKDLLRDLREREGFTYDIRCRDMEFVVTATPPRQSAGGRGHNPVITVNQDLQVREER
jgi:hypothetical protein